MFDVIEVIAVFFGRSVLLVHFLKGVVYGTVIVVTKVGADGFHRQFPMDALDEIHR